MKHDKPTGAWGGKRPRLMWTILVIAILAAFGGRFAKDLGWFQETKADQVANGRETVAPVGADGDHARKVRLREPGFQSVEEAEQALLGFDLSPIGGSDREEARRCLLRYRSLTGRIPDAFYSELASRLGEGADRNLMAFIRQMALYQEWGRVDFEAALADLSGIEDERRHSKALHIVFIGASEPDPGTAMTKAETLDIETPGEFGESERIDLMDTIFDHWIESDPFSAVEWAKHASLPAKRRDQWIADGLREWTKQDPDAAENWRERENFQGFKP